MADKMKGYKGFDNNLKCRDHQFEVGKSYTHSGNVKLCASVLYFVESPLDALSYYKPGDGGRYAEIEADGVTDEKESDTKRVASGITIKAELNLKAMIQAGLSFVFGKVKASDKTQATSGNSAHSATSGDSAHSATSGYSAHSATSGDSAHSATSGKESIAAAVGIAGQAKAAKGSWIVCAEHAQNADGSWKVLTVKTVKVDGKKIKADTYYCVKGGKWVEA